MKDQTNEMIGDAISALTLKELSKVSARTGIAVERLVAIYGAPASMTDNERNHLRVLSNIEFVGEGGRRLILDRLLTPAA